MTRTGRNTVPPSLEAEAEVEDAQKTGRGHSVLSEEDAKEIREAYVEADVTYAELAKMYDVGETAIYNVVSGVTYKDAPGPVKGKDYKIEAASRIIWADGREHTMRNGKSTSAAAPPNARSTEDARKAPQKTGITSRVLSRLVQEADLKVILQTDEMTIYAPADQLEYIIRMGAYLKVAQDALCCIHEAQSLAEDEETKEDLRGIRSTLRFPLTIQPQA